MGPFSHYVTPLGGGCLDLLHYLVNQYGEVWYEALRHGEGSLKNGEYGVTYVVNWTSMG